MEIHSVGDDLFHADRGKDGRTDITKLIVAFHHHSLQKYNSTGPKYYT